MKMTMMNSTERNWMVKHEGSSNSNLRMRMRMRLMSKGSRIGIGIRIGIGMRIKSMMILLLMLMSMLMLMLILLLGLIPIVAMLSIYFLVIARFGFQANDCNLDLSELLSIAHRELE